MARIVKVKNTTAVDSAWEGQTVLAGTYRTLAEYELAVWRSSTSVFASIANGELVVNDGTVDIVDVVKGWDWVLGDTMPKSDLGNKLAIHSSTKPAIAGKEFYLVWTGAGDNVTGSPPTIADGDLMQFVLDAGTSYKAIDVRFSPDFGDVYIHEGYAKWEGGGIGDYLSAVVATDASALQTAANLDLEIVDNWVKLAAAGPGTGTHGFAANPILIKRSKSKDGDWDYDAVNGLVPNTTGTGVYKISDIEREIHNYINRIAVAGSSYGYTRLTSDETAFLPPGYFLRVKCFNNSATAWTACIFMEVFREQTAVP